MNFYKPNSKNTGHAIGLNFNPKEGKLFAQIVKQVAWADTTKTGTFKSGATFNVTFNAHEIGAILNCIESSRAAKLFHQTDKGSTSIEWAPFHRKDTPEVRDGVTLSVNPRVSDSNKTPLKFGFWFNEGEARLLKEYLRFVLSHFFTAENAADKLRREAALSKKASDASNAPAGQDESF